MSVAPVRLEKGDDFTLSADKQTLTYRFANYGNIDGLDIKTACATRLSIKGTMSGVRSCRSGGSGSVAPATTRSRTRSPSPADRPPGTAPRPGSPRRPGSLGSGLGTMASIDEPLTPGPDPDEGAPWFEASIHELRALMAAAGSAARELTAAYLAGSSASTRSSTPSSRPTRTPRRSPPGATPSGGPAARAVPSTASPSWSRTTSRPATRMETTRRLARPGRQPGPARCARWSPGCAMPAR